MLWTCPLFCLTLFCAGVSLDIILKPDTETLTVLVGEPVTFRCSITGGDLKNYQVSWYKKNENNSLTLVHRLSNNSNDNVSNNFKGSIDAFKGQCILDIQRATIKDTGTYYCASDIHSATALLLVASEPLGQTEGAGPMRRPSVGKMCTTPRLRSCYFKSGLWIDSISITWNFVRMKNLMHLPSI